MTRVLIIKTSSMGDVIHALPAVTDLINNIPDVTVDWVVEKSFVDIVKNHKNINKIITINLRAWRKDLFDLNTYIELKKCIKNIRAEKYDYIIDAQGLFKSVLLSILVKKNKHSNLKVYTHGLDKSSIRGKYISWLYNKTYSIDKNLHAIDRLRLLFAEIFNYKFNNLKMTYGLNNKASKDCKVATNNKYLVFLHCTTWESKKWPKYYWQELIKLAIENGYQVKLNSGNQQEYLYTKQLIENIVKTSAESSNKIFAMPPQSIASLIGVISSSTGVVSVDTGLGHLAAALDKPGVGIFGATDTKKTAFLSDKFNNLKPKYSCSPCLLRVCDKLDLNSCEETYPPCYKEINPDKVWYNLNNIIKNN